MHPGRCAPRLWAKCELGPGVIDAEVFVEHRGFFFFYFFFDSRSLTFGNRPVSFNIPPPRVHIIMTTSTDSCMRLCAISVTKLGYHPFFFLSKRGEQAGEILAEYQRQLDCLHV